MPTRAARRLPWLVVTLACAGVPAVAVTPEGVKSRVLADGSTLIYNENEVQRARRTADRLLPVPRAELAERIAYHARQEGLSDVLVQAVVQVESGYNPRALSSKGAMGLMQLMPDTATELGVVDAWDPEENLRGGTRYLRRLLDSFGGDTTLALAAYNAGPGAVSRHGGVPPYRETIDYVRKILTLYRGAPPPALLVEHARDQARRRQAAAPDRPTGAAVYLVRDAQGRVVMTTSPPKTR